MYILIKLRKQLQTGIRQKESDYIRLTPHLLNLFVPFLI